MFEARPVRALLASLPLPSLPPALLRWDVGTTPISTLPEVFGGLALYLVVIFGGRWLMEDRKAFRESRALVGCRRVSAGGTERRLAPHRGHAGAEMRSWGSTRVRR